MLDDAILNDAVSFDPKTGNITVYEPSNLTLSGSDFTEYTIQVVGTSGNVNEVSNFTTL